MVSRASAAVGKPERRETLVVNDDAPTVEVASAAPPPAAPSPKLKPASQKDEAAEEPAPAPPTKEPEPQDPEPAAEAPKAPEAAEAPVEPDSAAAAEPTAEEPPAEAPPAQVQSFAELLELARRKREPQLCHHLRCDVHLVSFEQGRIELRTTQSAPRDLLGSLTKKLGEWTGRRWVVSHSEKPGEPTLREQEEAAANAARQAVMAHPVVKAVLENFPGAEIQRISAADAVPGAETEPGRDSAGEEEES